MTTIMNPDTKMIEAVRNYEDIKDKIFFVLLNYENNKEKLEGAIYERFYDDMVLVPYILFYKTEDGIASAMIKTDMMEEWTVNSETIIKQAKQNAPLLFPVEIKTLGEVLTELAGVDIGEGPKGTYVLTNGEKFKGAATLLYPNVLADFADKHKKDFLIFPSSIHETILLIYEPDNEVPLKDLAKMTKEINDTMVDPKDKLSDKVFYYEHDTKVVTPITDC